MKEIILVLAMQFSHDFNTPIDRIEYRTGDLNHFAVIRKKANSFYEITIDENLAKISSMEQLKTIVYHMTGKATGMEVTDTKKHFMNPKCILKPYKRLRH